MKIIEGLKKLKELTRKADDLKTKVSQHCADLDNQETVYPDQKRQVAEWIQAHGDICKEILSLRIRIQKTNLAVSAVVEIDGKPITKTIAEWIHRRKDLAKTQKEIWGVLGDRGLRPGAMADQKTGAAVAVNVRRHFDPVQRDKMLELYTSEPALIDAALEVVNATKDLIEE